MRSLLLRLPLLALLSACTDDKTYAPQTDDTAPVVDGPPQVRISTELGDIVVELNPEAAPATVDNFLSYVDEGFFDGGDGLGATIFHRVITDFVVQGGGYTEDGTLKTTHDPIPLESNNGLSNTRGTIAMARTNEPDSATSQFYINHVENRFLDYSGPRQPGYAVFGEVIEGIDTVDRIAGTPVDGDDQPLSPVVMTSVTRED